MRALRAALPILLVALASPAARADEAKEPKPKETPLAIVNGIIRSVDLDAHALVLQVDGTTATLGLDRNSLVYLPGGLSTVAALRPGDEVRAGRNARNVAYWIEVRRAARAPAGAAAKPGQGTGPGGASPPPAEGTSATPAPSTVGPP